MDSILLIPPGASQTACSLASAIQLGSWLDAQTGADYGARDLIHSLESSNALTDGGLFAARFAPPRHMNIPLIVNHLGSNTASAVMLSESRIRRAAMPGAMLAIQPEGVPTAEAVFFDVIDGRYEQNHNTFWNRAAVRAGNLMLSTQPFGYWPTEILLASAASVGFIGQLAVNGANLVGDAPAMAHVFIAPTVASIYPVGTWQPDMIAYSFGGRPSFQPFLPAASFSVGFGGSVIGDKFAPASQAMLFNIIGNPVWELATIETGVPPALEPAYRGRFRVFAFAKTTPSSLPWSLIVDSFSAYHTGALASSNQLATAYNVVASGNSQGSWVSASPAYSLLDMGEVTLPMVASGYNQNQSVGLRLWFLNPTVPAGATYQLQFAGLYLLPVDGAAGILTRGAFVPSISGAPVAGQFGQQGQIDLNSMFVDSVLITGTGTAVFSDGRANFRGLTPRIGASTNQITILTGDRIVGTPQQAATYPVVNGNVEYATVSVSYRPAFQFLHGL